MTAQAFDPNATDFGTDVAWNGDLAPVWGLVYGADNLVQAAGLHLVQREGSMDFYDPSYVCFDLRAYCSKKLDKTEVSRLRGRVLSCYQSDDRFSGATVQIATDPLAGTISLNLGVDTAAGPFNLVLLASSVSVDVLAVNGVVLPTPVPIPTVTPPIVISAGSSLPGPPGPPGTSNPSRNFAMEAVEGSLGTEEPQPQTQKDINWGGLGASITVELVGTGLDAGAGTPGPGIVRLRRDGSDGLADGTVIATVNLSSASATQAHGGTTFSNPGGYGRIILSVQSSAAGKQALFRDVGVTFES